MQNVVHAELGGRKANLVTDYTSGTASPGGTDGKEPTCQSRRRERCRFDPWVGKTPRRRARQPPPVSLPGESQDRGAGGLQPLGSQSQTWLTRLSAHAQVRNRWSENPGLLTALLIFFAHGKEKKRPFLFFPSHCNTIFHTQTLNDTKFITEKKKRY